VAETKRFAVLLNQAFADWETGFLSASAREVFAAEVLHFSPDGRDVTSEGGLTARVSGAYVDIRAVDFDAIIVCGSSRWTLPDAPDISPLLLEAEREGVVIGVICAATLTAARAGLLDDRRHTSNGAEWLRSRVPSYRGGAFYRDVNSAVFDRRVISAPGSAPALFARTVLATVFAGHPRLDEVDTVLSSAR
jgi:putative intracellular protease/amidase